MNRTFKTLGIFLSALFLLAACSSDDDFPNLKDEDFIETISDTGTIGYSKDYENSPGEHRWYIRCSPKMDFYIDGGTYYFPVSLPKEYQHEGTVVKFNGDIYPFESNYGGKYPSGGFPVGGYNYYYIKLSQIDFSKHD